MVDSSNDFWSEKNNKSFDDAYETVKGKLLCCIPQELASLREYIGEVTDYNVPLGKKNRGKMVAYAYNSLISSEEKSNENIFFAMVVGWCIEWLQASFLVHDDIMDGSLLRRGQKCWYKVTKDTYEYGRIAINDGIYLQNALYQILDLYVFPKSANGLYPLNGNGITQKQTERYTNITRLFHEVFSLTCFGQHIDVISSSTEQALKDDNANPNGIRWDNYTLENYHRIAKWKTSYYSFYLPIAAAMILADYHDKAEYLTVENISSKIGEYFQIQDDYLDVFGNGNITGKIGTDIQEGKCSWPTVKALTLLKAEELHLFKRNYGISNDESISIVKQLYVNCGIPALFDELEETMYQDINHDVQSADIGNELKHVLRHNLSIISKRNK